MISEVVMISEKYVHELIASTDAEKMVLYIQNSLAYFRLEIIFCKIFLTQSQKQHIPDHISASLNEIMHTAVERLFDNLADSLSKKPKVIFNPS